MADVSVAEFTKQASSDAVHVRTPEPDRLANLLAGPAVKVTQTEPGRLEVIGLISDQIGDIAVANNLSIHELVLHRASLEEAFVEMTKDSVEYRSTETGAA